MIAVLAVAACCSIGNAHHMVANHLRGREYRVVGCERVSRTVVDCDVLVLEPVVCQPGTLPSVFSVAVCEPSQWSPLRLRVHRGSVWERT